MLTDVPLTEWSHPTRWEDLGIDRTIIFQLPLTTTFRGVNSREGLLVHGPHGWGECAPFLDYQPDEAAQWLRSALAQATRPGPAPVRTEVPVNVTIPVSSPAAAAARAAEAGCRTAKIKVADPRVDLDADAARVAAVAEVLADQFGADARVRIDVNGSWRRDEACAAIELLQRAAGPVGGLEYVEQPCWEVEDLAAVRERVEPPIAADESIRRADDPFRVVGAVDLAVIKVAPLGGVRAALDLAGQLPLPVVVSSAIDTSYGLAAGVQLAAALPDLPHACGLDTARLLATDVVAEPLRSAGGNLDVARAARVLTAEPVAGAADRSVVERWLARTEAMLTEVNARD